jgi:phosphatidylserine/phosphatidylglycerophosphate/cardiolipin synthase-like enzyme
MERVRERGGPPGWTSGADATLLDGGPAAFPRMLAAIEAAEHEVRLEVYAFARDEVGGRFVGALSAAARRGVRVAVVIDGWGSLADGREVAALLRDAGCEVAIATDCNPGSSMVCDLLLCATVAATRCGLSLEEALWGVTRGGAKALGLNDRGSLAVGERASNSTRRAGG